MSWRIAGAAFAFGILVAVGVLRNFEEKQIDPEPPAAATILLPKDDVAAWITMNNTGDATYSDAVAPSRWSGVLFQLGTFRGPTYKAGNIEMFKDGQSVAVLAPGSQSFYWINVIADDPSRRAPIDPASVFYLFPSDAVSGTCSLTTDPCDRNRKIHGYQDVVSSLITYWHGKSGYEVAAVPNLPTDASKLANKYVFSLLDPVRVEVRKFDPTTTSLTWVDEQIFTVGMVDSIVVREEGKPQDFGAKQEPGWPFP